ncbi:transcriptional regulator [Nanoarchaeota archaeon]
MGKEHTPQELEVWYILPAIRKEFAEIMVKRGMKQKEVASILGLSEAAVSQYFKEKRATEIEFDKKMIKEIEKSVDIVIKDNEKIMGEVQRILNLSRKSKVLCKLHHKKSDNIPDKCKICLGV